MALQPTLTNDAVIHFLLSLAKCDSDNDLTTDNIFSLSIFSDIRSNGTATQSHMVDRSLVDHFNSLKLK